MAKKELITKKAVVKVSDDNKKEALKSAMAQLWHS